MRKSAQNPLAPADATALSDGYTLLLMSNSNAISVGLTTWPLMPLAIYGFHAWLFPENKPRWLVWGMPIALVLCYLVEIAVFWNLLL